MIPVSYDDLSTGWADAVKFGPLEVGDINDTKRLDAVFQTYAPDAVMHFAACSDIAESVRDPDKYWHNIHGGTRAVAEAALRAGCTQFVLSSTCSVYGDQDGVILSETSAITPNNAYGEAKRAAEAFLEGPAAAEGMRSVILRYFNVAGADEDAEVGEWHRPETHLVPIILDVAEGRRDAVRIFGTDYPTPDGSCVRDYVHVTDIADAHMQGLDWLKANGGVRTFNLGTGTGFSVRSVIAEAQAITGKTIPVVEDARRPGDGASLVSGGDRAKQDLGWSPDRSTLPRMIKDAWRWHQTGDYAK